MRVWVEVCDIFGIPASLALCIGASKFREFLCLPRQSMIFERLLISFHFVCYIYAGFFEWNCQMSECHVLSLILNVVVDYQIKTGVYNIVFI